ncbi:MAG TPA: choice-of-anchor D domain-containing protein, partial [Rhodanobacteraceae bacterium]
SLQVAQIVQPAASAPAMLSPNPFDFGDVVVGTSSAPQRFTLTNLMPESIDVEAPVIGNSQFAIVAETCTGATLAPGQTCAIDVTYTPAGALVPHDYPLFVGFYDSVNDSAPARVFTLIRAAGVPDAPFSRVEFDESACVYPETVVHSSSGAVRFTASNTGTLPVTITTFESTGDDFVLYRDGCVVGSMLAPGEACAVDAAFQPLAAERRQSALVFKFAADDTPEGFARTDLEGDGIVAGDAIRADGFESVICSPW